MRSAFNPAVRRLIRRDLTRNKGRTAILFLLTFLPLTFVLTIAIGSSSQPVDTSDWQYGQADAFFVTSGGAPSVPGDATVVSWSEQQLWFGSALLTVADAPVGHPLLDGYGSGGVAWNDLVVDGRLPAAPGEAAIAADALGDVAPLMSGDGRLAWAPEELTIVGTLGAGSFDHLLLLAPGSISVNGFDPLGRDEPATRGLIDWAGPVPTGALLGGFAQPDADAGFVNWVGDGGFIQTRDGQDVGADPEPIVVSALFSVGLAIATGAIAFATWGSSLRRRLRDVGVLAASGAAPPHLSAIQAGQAALISLGASVVALGAAIGLVVTLPVAEVIVTEGERELQLGRAVVAVLIPIAISVAVATIAGWWPARRAARTPLAAVLAGRTPQVSGTPGSWLVGAAAVVVGLGLLAASVSVEPSRSGLRSLVLGWLGLVSIALGTLPMLSAGFRQIGGSRVGASIPPVGRLVARNASRHAGRSAAAVLGIGAIVAAVWAGAVDAQQYRDANSSRQVAAAPGAFGPGSSTVVIGAASFDERERRVQAVLDRVSGETIGPYDALAADGPFGPVYQPDPELRQLVAGATDSLFFLSANNASAAPSRPDLDLTVIGVPAGLAEGDLDGLAALPGVAVSTNESFPLGPSASDPELTSQIVLLVIGFVVASIVIAMVASVVASEVADDLRILALVGTDSSFRLRFLTLQTFLFAGVGVVGGLVMGTLIRLAVDDGVPVPWHVVAGLVALPFVLAAGTAALTWRPNRPNRAPDFGMASAAP